MLNRKKLPTSTTVPAASGKRRKASSLPTERGICAIAFGTPALIIISGYLTAHPPPEQWWFLWPFIVVFCAGCGGTYGRSIFDPKATASYFEAIWRSGITFVMALSLAVIASMLSEGIELMVTKDAVAGIAKLLIVIPYGPFTAVFAVLNALWAIIPASILIGVLLFRLRNTQWIDDNRDESDSDGR